MAGWQYGFTLATSGVAETPLINEPFCRYKAIVSKHGGVAPNHVIVTMYEKGDHGIGWHSDKPQTLSRVSWITAVKLGASRDFGLRVQGSLKPFFLEKVQSGDAIIMTMEANVATEHSVPKVLSSDPSGRN